MLSLILFCLLVTSANQIDPSDFPTEDSQLLLTAETFPLALSAFPNLLVFFYRENDAKCEDFY